MKRILLATLIITMLAGLSACIKTKTLHCDKCGIAVEVEEDSNMEEDWIIYCGPCNEELFGEDGLPN